MFHGRKVTRPLRCDETVVFDADGGHCVEGCHGDSDHAAADDGGALGFHLYFCQCHQALCTYNTRTQEHDFFVSISLTCAHT